MPERVDDLRRQVFQLGFRLGQAEGIPAEKIARAFLDRNGRHGTAVENHDGMPRGTVGGEAEADVGDFHREFLAHCAQKKRDILEIWVRMPGMRRQAAPPKASAISPLRRMASRGVSVMAISTKAFIEKSYTVS